MKILALQIINPLRAVIPVMYMSYDKTTVSVWLIFNVVTRKSVDIYSRIQAKKII